MPTEEMYLARGPDGRMTTLLAHSIRGALKLYLHKHRRKLKTGDFVSIRRRGEDDPGWHDFRVS